MSVSNTFSVLPGQTDAPTDWGMSCTKPIALLLPDFVVKKGSTYAPAPAKFLDNDIRRGLL
jgi:hypothetical protein